jgi:hypothetical protein
MSNPRWGLVKFLRQITGISKSAHLPHLIPFLTYSNRIFPQMSATLASVENMERPAP